MNEKDSKFYWAIRNYKSMLTLRNADGLANYLQGCLDSGIKQDRLDKLIDKVNEENKRGF